MDSSFDFAKKQSLEDLSKEEIITKYRGLLQILQKAKHSKASLIEENTNLKAKLEVKSNSHVVEELVENLTQQKLELVTNLEQLQNQKNALENELKTCEYSLSQAESKVIQLDTQNQSYERQIKRLTEDNEQLLVQLDELEKRCSAFKKLGLEQQQKLLQIKPNDFSNELMEKNKLIESLNINCDVLATQNKELTEKYDNLLKTMEILEVDYKNSEMYLSSLKKQNENYINEADDLNIELHKNKALVEKLQQDIATMTKKLSNNQIESSGVASDLENKNEKLQNKLKFFHSKIVKFAGDVKVLKKQKIDVLEYFKGYVQQVKSWEAQLQTFSEMVLEQFKQLEEEKERLNVQITKMQSQNYDLQDENRQLTANIASLKLNINENEELKITNKQLTDEINKHIKYINEIKVQLESVNDEKILFHNHSSKLTNELKILNDQLEQEKTTLKIEIEHNQDLTQKSNTQEETIRNLFEINQNLIKKSEHLENELLQVKTTLEQLTIVNKNLCENNKDLQDKLQLLQTSEIKLSEQSTSEIKKLVEEKTQLIENIKQLESKLLETKTNVSEEQFNVIKQENAELLSEMNEMNQVLKERGETISKQQEYCEELLRNIKIFESQSNTNLETVQQKQEIIEKLEHDISNLNKTTENIVGIHDALSKKDDEITKLQDELSTLREKLLDSSHDAESENMSTSTISKTEEMNRIKDLEGSWEERYGKLRSLALKLKAKIRELTGELTKEQNEKTEVQQKLSNSLKTIQSLQGQCDQLQDDLDESRKEINDYAKKLDGVALNISNNKKQLAENEELITKLKLEIETLNKEKNVTDNWKKQVSGKVQNLKKELDAKNLLKKDFEIQISNINFELEAKDKLLKEEIEKHNVTKSLLQESNNECKKQSVLNLEMHDYERSLKDLTQKLDKKQELINKLKTQIDTQKNTVNAMKEQNRHLEERMQNEETDLTTARSEIQVYKKSINDLEIKLIQKDDKLHDLIQIVENCRRENEELSTQLSKVITENEKTCTSLKSEKDFLRSQNLGFEQKLHETEDILKIKDEELKEIHKEYQSYKVRAQSVLRQSQTRDIGLEEKLSEEAASFKAQVTILTSELEEHKNSLEKLGNENAKLKSEKEMFEKKVRDLESDIAESQKQHEELSSKYQKAISEHAEAVRGLKVHAETLAQCYRQQLSEQEVRHNQEIIELQIKMDKIVPTTEIPSLIAPTIPREQGEGSESIELTNITNTQPVPLDRLLGSDSDQDIGFIRKQVIENEAKVIHLTALLADTEQDLAKHVQMNKLLKEEIRRQQRSVEREQHAENLEYLKNVVFKFATLNSGDERSRLVPVLNTILKFSPEEANKLNMIARGTFGSRGWTNYLPIWSSPNK